MASSPITTNRWEESRTVTDYFLGSKISENGDCSHASQRRLRPGRKAMTNLDSTEKQRRHTVHLVKAMALPVAMYHKESRPMKKAERWGTDAFKLWCWRRLLRAPWAARTSNQSILKETNPECSLDGLMLKLKPQYFGHLMWRADLLEKTLMLRKTEGKSRRGWQRMDMNLSKLRETVMDREIYCAAVHEVTKSHSCL